MRKRNTWLWAFGGVSALAIVYFLFRKGGSMAMYSFGRKNTLKLNRDPNMLVPAFAERLELLFKNLRMLHFDPCFNEGYRSRERAEQLAKEGVGIKDSMHFYGAAADIISCTKGWNDPAFFQALGEEAEKLGLTWGGRWTNKDLAHVQAIPATTVAQNEVRNAVNVESVVRKYLV